MAHGAEQQNQFFLVVIGVAGLVVDLCHHDSVSFPVSVVECADGGGGNPPEKPRCSKVEFSVSYTQGDSA
jgi:hypothetical protein